MESLIIEWVDEKYAYLSTLSDEEAELEIIRHWGYGWYKDYAMEYYMKKVNEELRNLNLFNNNLF